ncbi:MAG: hypothetical protein CMN87_13795 [Stappia sp.]|nr:hypothetical protein [Stappia sp.]MBM21076.1 hypothetical protein [Stappia sp.]
MMKRLFLGMAVLAAVLAIGFVSLSAFVTGESTRARVESELSRWLGASVSVGSPVALSLRTTPVLTLRDVDLEDTRGGWSLHGATIDVDLALSGLVSGQARVSSISISGGRILLPDWHGDNGVFADAGALASSLSEELRRLLRHPLTVGGTTLVQVNPEGRESVLARDVSLRLSASGAGAVTLRGSLNAGDQTLQWTATLSDRAVLEGPGEAALLVNLASPLATLRLDGTLLRADMAWFRGNMEFAASDLRGLVERFGHDLDGEGAAFGAVRLAGSGEISATALSMTRADIEFDGNSGDGRLVLDLAGPRPRLEGTLAFDTLDLSAHVTEGIAGVGDEAAAAGWLRQPLQEVLAPADIDLRLSATRLVTGDVSIGPTAVSILLRDRDLSIDVGETRVDGGGLDLSARLRPDPAGEGFLGAATLVLDAIPAGRLPLPVEGPVPVAGTLSGRTQWNGRGKDLDALLTSASGTVLLKASGLRFSGGGADTLLAGLLGSDTVADPNLPSSFDFVSVELVGSAETLDLSSAEAFTPDHVLSASGRVSLPSGTLSLRGRLRKRLPGDGPAQTSDGASTGGSVEPEASGETAGLPVLVRGTVFEPLIVPDLTRVDERPTR